VPAKYMNYIHQKEDIEDKDCYKILFRNARGLRTNLPDILEHEADAQFITETDIAEYELASIHEDIKENGYHAHFGKNCNLAKTDDKRRGRRVAIIVKGDKDKSILPNDCNEDHDFLMDSGRWREITIPTAEKGFFITVAVVYGYSGASGSTSEYNANERLLSAAIRRAQQFKDDLTFSEEI
jgi:hypothetical protein